MKEPRIALREPQEEDAEELTALNLASSQFHAPWVTPPINVVAYWEYLLCCNREDTCGYLLCLGDICAKFPTDRETRQPGGERGGSSTEA